MNDWNEPLYSGKHNSTPQWYALFTMPKHEKSVTRFLHFQHVEHFLPLYETENTWRNRQRVLISRPLFPRYLFARIEMRAIGVVLKTPGVVQIVGTGPRPTPVSELQIESLRSAVALKMLEPYPYAAIGDRVRIKKGPLMGIEGTLVRKKNQKRLILTVSLIQQSVSVEVDLDTLEVI